MQMNHKSNKALKWNENRSCLKERRPRKKKLKSAFANKYNLIGRAPYFLASNSAALIDCFNKKQQSHLIHFRIRQH